MTEVAAGTAAPTGSDLDSGASGNTGSALGAAGTEGKPAGEGAPASALGGAGAEGGEGKPAGGDQGQGGGDNSGGSGEVVITLPEGTNIDDGTLDWFKGVSKESGLTSESASKMATEFAKRQAASTEQAETDQAAAIVSLNDGWVKEMKEDADYGGAKYDATIQSAQSAVMKFGGVPLAKELDRVGMGNHPMLIRAFAKIGASFAEDNSGKPNPNKGNAQQSEEERLRQRYPNS